MSKLKEEEVLRRKFLERKYSKMYKDMPVKHKGYLAYEMRKEGFAWRDIENVLNTKYAMLSAKNYAVLRSLEWPVKVEK